MRWRGGTHVIRDTSAMDTPLDPARRRLRWPARAAIGALVVVALVVVARPALRRWSSSDASIELSRIRIAPVVRGDLVYDVGVQGKVVAASRPTLFSPSTGIVSLRVREGEEAKSGTVLAVVESPEVQNRLAQEAASLDALRSAAARLELDNRQHDLANRQAVELGEVRVEAGKRAVARAEELAAQGLLSASELETARDNLRIATIELTQAKQRVDLEGESAALQVRDAQLRLRRQELVVEDVRREVSDLTIRSPFDGLVATVSVKDRDAVVRGQAVVAVVDLHNLEIEVNIPESYASRAAPGTEAEVTVDNGTRPGRLTSVTPEVRDGQVEGRVAFVGGPPPGLRQNQRLSTRLILAHERNVLKVPRGPFVEAGGGRWVYVVGDGLARRRPVEIGAVSVGEVEITSGLTEGEQIVLSDLSQLQGAETVLLRR
jgi:HlyD family secretion protein